MPFSRYTFAARLIALRENDRLTKKAAAKGCLLSPAYLSQLEKGDRSPGAYTIIAIAEFYRVSTDFLLGHH